MDRLFVTFHIFILFLANSTALELQLFDSANFSGPYLISNNDEGCTNLTTENFIQEARSLKTDTCVLIFKEPDCGNYSIRLDPGRYDDLSQVKHETINFVNPMSYRPCTAEEGGVAVNVDIIGSAMAFDGGAPPYEGLLLQYRDVCSCINLATKNPYIATVKEVHNYGNCIKLYASANCGGQSVELLGGVSPQSTDLASIGSFIIPPSSIGPCTPRPTCHTLNATIFKFELLPDENARKVSTESNVAMTSKTSITNNGSATVTQEYTATKVIREVVEVTRATKFGSNVFSTVTNIQSSGCVSWYWFCTRVSSTLTEAYTTNDTVEDNAEKFTSDESREVSVSQQIQIPPCSVYHVDSYVSMLNNYPMIYKVYSYVTGKSKDGPLTKDEVRERLTVGLVYVEDYDNFTVIAEGFGSVKADFSIEAAIDGASEPLEGCSARL